VVLSVFSKIFIIWFEMSVLENIHRKVVNLEYNLLACKQGKIQ